MPGAAHHLAERPERDPVAIGRGAALVPIDELDHPVDVLQELPGQARLADAGLADDAHEPHAAFASGAVVKSLIS